MSDSIPPPADQMSLRATAGAGLCRFVPLRAWRPVKHHHRCVKMLDVVLVLFALTAGAAAGYARRGRLGQLAAIRPSRNRLVLTALGSYALGVGGGWAWQPLLPALTALCWVILGYYAWLNRRHGAQLLALGLAANGLAILINGAMPVSPSAEARAGVTSGTTITDQAITTSDSAAPWLGKVIPVAFPPRPEVVSPGDIAIAAGSAVVLARAMTVRGSSRTATESRSNHQVGEADAESAARPGALSPASQPER